ncbi:MAG TPA: hypothetical protein VF257_17435 [Solirubrobacteraceae bacterium]
MRLRREHELPPPPAIDDDLGRLLRLAHEGLYWQDEVEDLLVAIRDGGDLGELARAGGPLISRYEAMRVEVRALRHPELRRYVSALDEVFAHHAMALHCALDLLAVSWRSERLREEQARLGDLGAQAERMVALTRQITEMARG